jgi:hypothetical protein
VNEKDKTIKNANTGCKYFKITIEPIDNILLNERIKKSKRGEYIGWPDHRSVLVQEIPFSEKN